ncbi:hypothetical protein GIB67_040975 [Kingdonia uniflora]|uniref:Uncharacterized protein n=1 Tax=Kingdonia uniflora TaxID=39325 RepID=A0A7J7NCB0_9MAGN|nr:hypothetical protein GIB67_040975 [Kingdonia uniflora]
MQFCKDLIKVILVGPLDWEDHSRGKEGIERYRTHNLPNVCASGVYELGVAIDKTNLGRNGHKLDHCRVISLYVGKATNVRERLQTYGRSGDHLALLFKATFSTGNGVLYRWAPMKNEMEAGRVEALHLSKYDYAWNKSGNGFRRDDEILEKLEFLQKLEKKTLLQELEKVKTLLISKFFGEVRKYMSDQHFSGKKQKGIRIRPGAPPLPETQLSSCYNGKSDCDFIPQSFMYSRSRPRLVSDKSSLAKEYSNNCGISRINGPFDLNVCGVSLEDGSVCKDIPIKGRKRCGEHKGQRVNEYVCKSKTELKSMCGMDLGDGSVCLEVPVPGRKRCELHKGRRVKTSLIITLKGDL